ncbi:hypothetical protein X975_13223, partial [Stegodyphus mimosarum]
MRILFETSAGTSQISCPLSKLTFLTARLTVKVVATTIALFGTWLCALSTQIEHQWHRQVL